MISRKAALSAVILLAMTGCAAMHGEVTTLTGTSLSERCALYRAGAVTADALLPAVEEIEVVSAAIDAMCATNP